VVSDFKLNWAFGKWITASGVVWTFNNNLYPWLLTAFHGTSMTGMWAACFGVVAMANPLFLGIQNYFGPVLAIASQRTVLQR